MKHLKKFEAYSDLDSILLDYKIYKYVILRDGTVDVDQDVDLSGMDLLTLPINFNRINGNFDISDNELESLKGGPNYVSGNFDCSINHLQSLDYMPKFIGGSFDCYSNDITYIDLTNKTINGTVDFTINPITNIKGIEDLNKNKVDETAIGSLVSCLLDIYLGQNRPGLNVINTKSIYEDILNNMIDFEVIKNKNEIDIISLNGLFDFYNLDFDLLNVKKELEQSDNYNDTLVLSLYKFINE